jgi:uncharacterized protein (TIGR03066 family)
MLSWHGCFLIIASHLSQELQLICGPDELARPVVSRDSKRSRLARHSYLVEVCSAKCTPVPKAKNDVEKISGKWKMISTSGHKLDLQFAPTFEFKEDGTVELRSRNKRGIERVEKGTYEITNSVLTLTCENPEDKHKPRIWSATITTLTNRNMVLSNADEVNDFEKADQ